MIIVANSFEIVRGCCILCMSNCCQPCRGVIIIGECKSYALSTAIVLLSCRSSGCVLRKYEFVSHVMESISCNVDEIKFPFHLPRHPMSKTR